MHVSCKLHAGREGRGASAALQVVSERLSSVYDSKPKERGGELRNLRRRDNGNREALEERQGRVAMR